MASKLTKYFINFGPGILRAPPVASIAGHCYNTYFLSFILSLLRLLHFTHIGILTQVEEICKILQGLRVAQAAVTERWP